MRYEEMYRLFIEDFKLDVDLEGRGTTPFIRELRLAFSVSCMYKTLLHRISPSRTLHNPSLSGSRACS